MKVYLSTSWKNRERVRQIANELLGMGYEVYDFTDPACRKSSVIPPEKFPEEFDPDKHVYREYINRPEWKAAVMENLQAIVEADIIILLLPCGVDSHADWALGVGMGKPSIVVGHPKKGERSPVHLWASTIVDTDADMLAVMKMLALSEARQKQGGGAMRLIDADALIDFIDCGHLRNPLEACFSERDVVDMLESRPSVDAVPVVHGQWVQCKTPLGKIYSVCSNCKTDFKFKTDKGTLARLDMDGMPFCPNCGAGLREAIE